MHLRHPIHLGVVLSAIAWLALPPSLVSAQGLIKAGNGQLGSEVTWIPVPLDQGAFFKAQKSEDGKLLLTANEAFFPERGLVATGVGAVPDVEKLNGGKTFQFIKGWKEGDTAEWGLFFEKPGSVRIKVLMTTSTNNGQYTLKLGENTVTASTRASNAKPVSTSTYELTITNPGQHILQFSCQRAGGDDTFHWIEISGSSVKDGAVLRQRWRPAAAHTKFTSSGVSDGIRIWVMEMDALPGSLGFYSPITTPFGYYGPTWNADGTVGSGFYFSLWSYGRGQSPPPLEQHSHLLAIGNRQASFGSFGHEGTGVKVRDWEPLAGRQGQSQVIALRVEPGNPYDTYFSYFYATDQQRWRLFAVGNKYNGGKPLRSLWVGSFVEVPGPPHIQRTGPYERTMRYRGWVLDKEDRWQRLDQMANGNIDRNTGLTHTDRGLAEDWFYLRTGGWKYRKGKKSQYISLPTSKLRDDVSFLGPQDTAFLKTTPSQITASVTQRSKKQIEFTIQVRNAEEDPEVHAFWGTKDALTFADQWQNQRKITALEPTATSFTIEGIPTEETAQR